MSKGILVVGAGGHGRVVADTARSSGAWERIAFIDDARPVDETIDGIAVIGPTDAAAGLLTDYTDAVIAIGDARKRLDLANHFSQLGFVLSLVIHPSAAVSDYCTVGQGRVVFAQAAINAGDRLGEDCIVNTGAMVDHDCVLDDGFHVAPGTLLAGAVKIGQGSWIGIGSAVREYIEIGAWVTVGAGASVVADVSDGLTEAGVPARPVNKPGG